MTLISYDKKYTTKQTDQLKLVRQLAKGNDITRCLWYKLKYKFNSSLNNLNMCHALVALNICITHILSCSSILISSNVSFASVFLLFYRCYCSLLHCFPHHFFAIVFVLHTFFYTLYLSRESIGSKVASTPPSSFKPLVELHEVCCCMMKKFIFSLNK